MKRFLTTIAFANAMITVALGQSNIDPAHKHAWSETGWSNWRDANAGIDGVQVHATYLEGLVWTESGWMNVGNGPVNGVAYANLDHTDFGVNIDASGDLNGYAWSEEGWVNFDTTSHSPDQARYDVVDQRFRGYAWSETGWVNLDDANAYVGTTSTCVLAAPPISGTLQNAAGVPVGWVGSRSLTVEAGNPNRLTAIRVTAIDLTNFGPGQDFSVFNGTEYWLQTPSRFSNLGSLGYDTPCLECSNNGNPCTQDADCGGGGATCDPVFPAVSGCNAPDAYIAAEIGTTPVYRDWSLDGMIVVRGERIIPSSSYEIKEIDSTCNTAIAANFSEAAKLCDAGPNHGQACLVDADCAPATCEPIVSTVRWGNSVELAAGQWRAPENKCLVGGSPCLRDSDCGTGTCGVVNVADTLHVVAAFAGAGDFKWRSDFSGDVSVEIPNGKITVLDTIAALAAFAGADYPGLP